MRKSIEEIICEELHGDDQVIANKFVAFLRKNNFEFIRDEGFWKHKIYFILKYKEEYVCFISIQDPEEPQNRWTVWSDNIHSKYLEETSVNDSLKQIAWENVDRCGHCGACGGGKSKMIFGKEFKAVCGCTFRFDNPQSKDLPFMEYMIEAKVKQIDANKTV